MGDVGSRLANWLGIEPDDIDSFGVTHPVGDDVVPPEVDAALERPPSDNAAVTSRIAPRAVDDDSIRELRGLISELQSGLAEAPDA